MAKSIDQIELIAAIARHLEEEEGIDQASPRIFNAIIEGANLIVEACGRDDVMATPGMGIRSWRVSDDTGISSKYLMELIASGSPRGAEYGHPHDSDDWGRCDRMLDACGLRERLGEIKGKHPAWDALVDSWDKIKSAYDSGNFVEADLMVKLSVVSARRKAFVAENRVTNERDAMDDRPYAEDLGLNDE